MSKIDVVSAAMVQAMKSKDQDKKDALSMLLSALKNAEIDKRSLLTEDEENAIVKKEIKQCQETYDSAPSDRTDIKEEAALRIAVYKEFAPEDMSVEQIKEVIQSVLEELGIEKPAPADKGKIMKILMPKVKGKADGKVVNEVLAGMSKQYKSINSADSRNEFSNMFQYYSEQWKWGYKAVNVILIGCVTFGYIPKMPHLVSLSSQFYLFAVVLGNRAIFLQRRQT